MTQAVLTGRDAEAETRSTHDRRASADVGYRVWNPFEIELGTGTWDRYDEAAKGFTSLIDVFKSNEKKKAEPQR